MPYFNRTITLILFIWSSLVFSQEESDKHLALKLIDADAKLFEMHQKKYDQLTIYDGPIEYIRDERGEEGYLPSGINKVNGTYTRTIYDFSEDDSPLLMSLEFKQELIQKGFEIIYDCSGDECGDIAGWRLYMSRYIDGDTNKQHYILAKYKNANKSNANHKPLTNHDWYIAFYINEFSLRPRAIIDVVVTQPIELDIFTINEALLKFSIDSGHGDVLNHLLFAKNSASIPKASHGQLFTLGKFLVNNPITHIQILGYADQSGALAANQILSKRRALSVKRFLVDHFDIDPNRIVAVGKGVANHFSSDTQARRVEILKVNDGSQL